MDVQYAQNRNLCRPGLRTFFVGLLAVFVLVPAESQLEAGHEVSQERVLTIENDLIACNLVIRNGILSGERISGKPDWVVPYGTDAAEMRTDGDFAFELMWTGWRAPGRANNADNLVRFNAQDFQFERTTSTRLSDGTSELRIFFRGKSTRLSLQLVVQLEAGAFYVRRKIALRDSLRHRHFLQKIWPLVASMQGEVTIIHEGGFGQPIGWRARQCGGFVGVEYPAAENLVVPGLDSGGILSCSHEVGQVVDSAWVESEWVVQGLAPNRDVKRWFMEYVSRIRVVPVRPYTLYNTWYDLRSPEYTSDQRTVMNEQNVMRTVTRLRQSMVDRYGITLDAFVLDDGWDEYRSDWVLRRTEFPVGLQSISYPLRSMGTSLGIWIGPTGGYSHRDWRVEWMKEHGYEVVGDELCLGGEKYQALFKTRVLEFIQREGVKYFKWDGIQFSCSEPDHGHPVGVYSRRAILNTLIGISQAAREADSAVYINTTSGTWLSPWWVKYSNQIWMGGQDYGYAEVPSISMRDAAMTYRDYVLYDDFRVKKFWFPIANLMTHGIIKGSLERLGGEDDPLEKFTDDVVLYLARGVSMWELYVSPDILSDGEWNALAQGIKWAKDRFPTLEHTEMVGGNPKKLEPYGYVHFKDKRGVIAARNPFIAPATLSVRLDPSLGLDPNAAGLVLERVYPTRWISPKLFFANDSISVALDGYETAIYEVYPLEEATGPLVGGVRFTTRLMAGVRDEIRMYPTSRGVRLLNPGTIKSLRLEGQAIKVDSFAIRAFPRTTLVRDPFLQGVTRGKRTEVMSTFTIDSRFQEPVLAVLLNPNEESQGIDLPELTVIVDGKQQRLRLETQPGLWTWAKVELTSGEHATTVRVTPADVRKRWKGSIALWIIGREQLQGVDVSFESVAMVGQRPLPPSPWPAGEVRRNILVGKTPVEYLP